MTSKGDFCSIKRKDSHFISIWEPRSELLKCKSGECSSCPFAKSYGLTKAVEATGLIGLLRGETRGLKSFERPDVNTLVVSFRNGEILTISKGVESWGRERE